MNSLGVLIGGLFGLAVNLWWLWLILGLFFPPLFIVGIVSGVIALLTPSDTGGVKDSFNNIPIGKWENNNRDSFKPKGWKD